MTPKNPLNMINVTPLIPGQEKAITDDLKNMYRDRVISSAAFIFTLVPEGDPVIDKATRLADLYRRNAALMQDCDMPLGILLQATMGMGWTPDEKASYQKFTLMDGTELYVFCPLGQPFLDHIHTAVSTVAALKPAFYMVDDDTRMITGRNGCFCPLHIAKFNEITGMDFTRETLVEALKNEPEKWAKQWDDLQRDSVVGLARTIRNAIDTADPAAPVYFCECGSDVHHAPAMLKALAAPGQKPVLRINNGAYLCDTLKWMPYWMMRTMWQVCALPKDYTLLSETDTCPQNRYSTSAAILHLHYAWSTLIGCRGAKLWITQTSNYDPETGKKYRATLRDHADFYRAIAAMKPRWNGFAEVLMNCPERATVVCRTDTWATQPRPTWGVDVFSLFGFPYSFEPYRPGLSKERTVLLSGDKMKYFHDDELAEMLTGRVLLDGEAAIDLTKRGLGPLLGLRAEAWTGPAASYEEAVDGTSMHSGSFMAKLTDLQPGAEVRSTVFHKGFALAEKGDPVSPGLVRYHNAQGGYVITCAAILKTHPDSGFSPFGMLRHNRKLWLARECGVGMYYRGTAPMYFCTFTDNGRLTAVAVNFGLDVETELPLANIPENTGSAGILQPDGSWRRTELKDGAVPCNLPPGGIMFIRF